MGFWSLQHIRNRRSTKRGYAGPLRSAFRVWLPSWRFPPFESVPVFFHTGGAHGIHPSERSPLERFPARFRPKAPTYRLDPPVIPPPKRRAGPTGSGFWVSTLPRVPCGRRGFSPPTTGYSHGFRPSRAPHRQPWTAFRPSSSPALRRTRGKPRNRPAPQSLDQLATSPTKRRAEARQPNRATLLGFLHRLDPVTFGQKAFRAMSSPHTAVTLPPTCQ
jgi:hypothetical protein